MMVDWTLGQIAERIIYDTNCISGEDAAKRKVAVVLTWLETVQRQEKSRSDVKNQELQNEVNRLTRNEKCYGCGHSRENHDPRGCLVWVEADAHRKCLCKIWTASEKRTE